MCDIQPRVVGDHMIVDCEDRLSVGFDPRNLTHKRFMIISLAVSKGNPEIKEFLSHL